jgi:hypothetical protein
LTGRFAKGTFCKVTEDKPAAAATPTPAPVPVPVPQPSPVPVPSSAPRSPEELPDHPLRVALLDLLADGGTVTSTEAAARLGESSGLCSFHLRQLARHGLIEEAPRSGGRARPWRLRWERPQEPATAEPATAEPATAEPATAEPASVEPAGFDVLARGLEDESHRRWLAQRDGAPQEWRADEAFSTVVHLTPQELRAVAEAVRGTLAGYRHRDVDGAARPADARPVAFVSRLFPLLPDGPDGAE